MPSIEITDEQAEALVSGETIVIHPDKPKRWIIKFSGGNVYDVTTRLPVHTGVVHMPKIKATLVAKGSHGQDVGFEQVGIGGTIVECFEIDR